uniref:NADH dehydrogenase subunit 5 n=1 Tax=Hyalomma scupense TaxID=1260755 RepID=UPI001FAF69E3|nr:NADH dehydrogenase subunit 5 [Hyalomma scupense]UNO54321.1 NADH dehydrogenase subunit 5 [Hyalomma scupense]
MILFFLSLIFFLIFFILMNLNFFFALEYSLVSLNTLEYKFYFLFDWMSCFFSFIVLLISSMVLVYSNSYMKLDKNKNAFCYMVLLFILSMMLLILMPNALMFILGWDGLGLISYCLVIYYQSINSYNSGMMTILSNRIGDVMLIMMIIFAINFNSFNLLVFQNFEKLWGIMIIIAGLTKSAQIPFSAWLPAAMAAPTPVSSLVHSSTLVTAGVYMLIRFNFLFNFEFFSNFLLKISLMTMVMSGMNACLENDLKKIIAFSTLSQLSMMMLVLAMNLSNVAFFHLIMHAIFKSMLFLCAGFVIHSLLGFQDIRMLANFFKMSPIIMSCMMISMYSLMGIPFIGGFYSKDLILESILMNNMNLFMMLFFIIGIILTLIYNFRLIYYLFLKGVFFCNNFKVNFDSIMIFPIFFLTLILILTGNLFLWVLIPNLKLIFLSNLQKILMLMIFMSSLVIFFLLNLYKIFMKWNLDFFMTMWYMSKLTSYLILMKNKFMLKLSINDWTWMELLGPMGLKKMIYNQFEIPFFKNLNSFFLLILVMMMFLFMSI